MIAQWVAILIAITTVSTSAFMPMKVKTAASSTKLYENFNLDFGNPKIESAKEIFTEKQLREYTATYSVDERVNPLEFVFGLFKKEDADGGAKTATKAPAAVSLGKLQEKTALYVKGKIDAKSFYAVLKSAFGSKLPGVLPEILSTLPKNKAAALSKVAK